MVVSSSTKILPKDTEVTCKALKLFMHVEKPELKSLMYTTRNILTFYEAKTQQRIK